jgi:hypothetical protein
VTEAEINPWICDEEFMDENDPTTIQDEDDPFINDFEHDDVEPEDGCLY